MLEAALGVGVMAAGAMVGGVVGGGGAGVIGVGGRLGLALWAVTGAAMAPCPMPPRTVGQLFPTTQRGRFPFAAMPSFLHPTEWPSIQLRRRGCARRFTRRFPRSL